MKTEYFWQVAFILLGALASAYGGYWLGNQPDQSSIIEYRMDSNSNLQQLIGNTDKIKITYGEDNLDALSNISFLIANTSKKNLDKIKIYFEVDNKEKLPIFHNVSAPKNHPNEAITLISEKDGIYIFELEYLNRTDSIWEGINFSFYFGGGEPPKIGVKTGTKGVSIRQYSYENISTIELVTSIVTQIWWLLLLYIAGLYFFVKFNNAHKIGKDDLYKKTIALEIANASGKEQPELVECILNASKKDISFKEVLKLMFKSNNS